MFFRRYIMREWTHFQSLSYENRRLLLSYLLVGLSGPMTGVFVNAFLWRYTQDARSLMLYNGGFFLALPVGFYINGLLLRRASTVALYWLGCVLQGLVPFALIFGQVTELHWIGLLGLLFGFAAGLFWANRNLMTLTQTHTDERLYVGSLESVLGTLTSIVVPVLIGWFLVFGEAKGWYSIQRAYEIVGVGGVVILFFAGWCLRPLSIRPQIPRFFILSSASRRWNALRWLEYVHGVHGGTEIIIPTLMILSLIGEEGSLGLVQSLSAVCAAFAIYVVGRRARAHHRPHLLGVWIIVEVLASASFALLFSSFSVVLYTLLIALVAHTRWVTLMSITYDVIDGEERLHGQSRYASLFDRELFLNLGRVTGLLLFFGVFVFDEAVALRYTLLFTSLLQWLVFGVGKRLNHSFAQTA